MLSNIYPKDWYDNINIKISNDSFKLVIVLKVKQTLIITIQIVASDNVRHYDEI